MGRFTHTHSGVPTEPLTRHFIAESRFLFLAAFLRLTFLSNVAGLLVVFGRGNLVLIFGVIAFLGIDVFIFIRIICIHELLSEGSHLRIHALLKLHEHVRYECCHLTLLRGTA